MHEVLEYSFHSTSGRIFQFPVPVCQTGEQLLELYGNLAPSPSSCELRILRLNSLEIALQPRHGGKTKGRTTAALPFPPLRAPVYSL